MRLAILLLVGCAPGSPPSTPAPGSPASSASPAAAPSSASTPSLADARPELLAEPNRPLTSDEIALLKPLFRDGIDYASVRVINNSFPLQPENVYMTPRGHVYAPGPLWQDDFSKSRPGIRAVFVHEMTHVWQHANGMDLIAQAFAELAKHGGAYEKAYPYELEPGRDLIEYGMEQQASIVEDYFTRTVDHETPQRITNRNLSDAERDALYASVLGKFLANARYAKGLDAKTVAEQHAKAAATAPPGPQACRESEQQHGATHLCAWRYERAKP